MVGIALNEYAKSEDLEGDTGLAALLEIELEANHDEAGYRQVVQLWINKLKEWSATRQVSRYAFATLYTVLGNKDEAISWLNKCVDVHASWVVLIRSDPKFDGLRLDPRFTKLLEREGPVR